MFKKITAVLVTALFVINLCGCAAVLVGAGAAGGAVWFDGKLKQVVEAPLPKVINATTYAMNALKLPITKTTVTEDVAQIKGEYTDGRIVWIDIHHISEKSCQVSIRVGVRGDSSTSQKILNKILSRL